MTIKTIKGLYEPEVTYLSLAHEVDSAIQRLQDEKSPLNVYPVEMGLFSRPSPYQVVLGAFDKFKNGEISAHFLLQTIQQSIRRLNELGYTERQLVNSDLQYQKQTGIAKTAAGRIAYHTQNLCYALEASKSSTPGQGDLDKAFLRAVTTLCTGLQYAGGIDDLVGIIIEEAQRLTPEELINLFSFENTDDAQLEKALFLSNLTELMQAHNSNTNKLGLKSSVDESKSDEFACLSGYYQF